MIKAFELENLLDNKLSKMEASHLNQLYLRVFNTDDGLLVLRDLANRCHANMPTTTERESGCRDAYLSIITRMKNAVTNE